MTCVNCRRIRSAVLHGKMAEAMGITVETLREKIGLGKPAPEGAEKFTKGGVIKPSEKPLIVGEQSTESFTPKPRSKKAD